MTNNDALRSPKDVRDYKIKALDANKLPASFKLDIEVPVKNQGTKSTCVAHALSSIVEYHFRKTGNDYREFSTEFIYGLREPSDHQSEGMIVRQALRTIQTYGDVYHDDLPGNHNYKKAKANVDAEVSTLKDLAYPHRISAYFKLTNEAEVKTALMQYGPVAVTMTTYNGAILVKDVYTYKPEKKRGAHCVFIYGWDERGWLVQNSWGELYGWDGRFVIPYDFKFIEMWGIADDIVDKDVIKPKRNKWLDIIYKIINTIMNMLNK